MDRVSDAVSTTMSPPTPTSSVFYLDGYSSPRKPTLIDPHEIPLKHGIAISYLKHEGKWNSQIKSRPVGGVSGRRNFFGTDALEIPQYKRGLQVRSLPSTPEKRGPETLTPSSPEATRDWWSTSTSPEISGRWSTSDTPEKKNRWKTPNSAP